MLRSCQGRLTHTTNTRQDPYRLTWPDLTQPGLNAWRRHLCSNLTWYLWSWRPQKSHSSHTLRRLIRSSFSRLLGHWPDLRGHQLTYDLKTGYRWLRLVTTYTMLLLFFCEALAQLRAKREGGAPIPLLCHRRTQNGLSRQGLTQIWSNYGPHY